MLKINLYSRIKKKNNVPQWLWIFHFYSLVSFNWDLLKTTIWHTWWYKTRPVIVLNSNIHYRYKKSFDPTRQLRIMFPNYSKRVMRVSNENVVWTRLSIAEVKSYLQVSQLERHCKSLESELEGEKTEQPRGKEV